ncbi:Vitamin B12 transport system substrate-binding [Candidatus Magnetaquicoccaceae bacterium FCR-1]|uniref:Vitamin B12 transport system substrate-binding n=1 Tax=Candidatus Magnetaquiglobus chichijimensis TaxID=3141448 RepID=A0ABQ0C6C8_9PROT
MWRGDAGRLARLLLILWLGWCGAVVAAPTDPPFPRRIVALAPNLTELLFAVGAGGQLVAVADYSDHPPDARAIPRIGGYDRFDPEAVIAARPDLVIGWPGGNPEHLLESLKRFGLTVWLLDPRRLDDIPAALETLASLTGHKDQGDQQAAAFRERLERLRSRPRQGEPVRVFYQVWHEPLMTVNGDHLISDVIRLCGGENIFADLPGLAPVIDLEAVLARDPEAIVASGMDASRPEWLDRWQRWSPLLAVRRGNLFFVPPDLLQRHTPRILDGAELLCDQMAQARQRRGR